MDLYALLESAHEVMVTMVKDSQPHTCTCAHLVHMSAREERDGGTDGRRVSNKKTYFREYANDARAERLWAGREGRDGPVGQVAGPAGRPRPGGGETGRLGRI
jgi:hypothetical protein